MDIKNRVHLPQLKAGSTAIQENDWPKGPAETVEQNLIAKLPFIFINPKNAKKKIRANDENISVFRKFSMTPVPSNTRAERREGEPEVISISPKRLANLTLTKAAKKHNQNNANLANVNYIEIVDSFADREIQPKPSEITSPYHITISTHLQNNGEGRKSSDVRFDTQTSHYKYPTATNPFCIGRSLEKSKSAAAWRDSQKQVFLWESQFSASRIHDNFKHGNLERYYGKKLEDFQKPPTASLNVTLKSPPNVKQPVHAIASARSYQYPERFIPFDQSLPATAPSVLRSGYDSSTVLEFLLDVTELKHEGKDTLSRLQTAVEKVEKKGERYRRKLKTDSRDQAAMLCRKMYNLEF